MAQNEKEKEEEKLKGTKVKGKGKQECEGKEGTQEGPRGPKMKWKWKSKIDVVSMWIDVKASMWHRCGISDVDRCGIDVASMWQRCGSMEGLKRAQNVETKRKRKIKCGSMWHRCKRRKKQDQRWLSMLPKNAKIDQWDIDG